MPLASKVLLFGLGSFFLFAHNIHGMKRPADDDITQEEETVVEIKRKRNARTPHALCNAIKQADMAACEILLSAHDSKVNEKDCDGMYPLWYAAEKGFLPLLRRLWGLVTVPDVKEQALILACAFGHEAIVHFILETRRDFINVRLRASLLRKRAFGEEVHPEFGPTAHVTPLLAATYFQRTAVVKLLLTYYPNLQLDGLGERTPLRCAVAGDYKEIITLLIAAGALQDANTKLHPSVRLAVALGNKETVEQLLQANPAALKSDRFADLIICALKNKHQALADFLLEKELRVYKSNSCDRLIRWMIRHDNLAYLPAIQSHYSDKKKLADIIFKEAVPKANIPLIAEILATNPAKINEYVTWQEPRTTALGYACTARNSELVRFLCDKGARMNLPSAGACRDTLSTPLVIALHNRCYHIAELLLQKGADVNRRGPDGKRAIEVYQDAQDVCIFLITHGASIEGVPALKNLYEKIARERKQDVKAVEGNTVQLLADDVAKQAAQDISSQCHPVMQRLT